jgi:hypothetical protein
VIFANIELDKIKNIVNIISGPSKPIYFILKNIRKQAEIKSKHWLLKRVICVLYSLA